MKFIYLIIWFTVLGIVNSYAQYKITGLIKDDVDNVLPQAKIILDSNNIVLFETKTDVNGLFNLKCNTGEYHLTIKKTGFQMLSKSIKVSTDLDLGILKLDLNSKQLNDAHVIETVNRVRQNGDTTEVNANSFKVNQDADAEKLLLKMPGISVSNGKVQAQGEDVKKVYLDGKEYFGDDVTSSLKNIPSEMIDKVQIFDQMSEQAQFTGFSNGNSSKSINLITKNKFKNGSFGKGSIGYGTDTKHMINGVLNTFKDKRKVTILFNSNSLNQQNFSSEDLAGVMSGGGRRDFGRSGGQNSSISNDPRDFLISNQNGVANTNAFGLNYSNNFKNKLELSTSYFFNRTKNNSISNLSQNYFSEINPLDYSQNENATTTNLNHRFNLRLKYKFDSNNTLIFKPSISLQKNSGNHLTQGLFLLNNLNNSITKINKLADLDAYNFSNLLVWQHKFKRKGRTLSLTTNYNEGENNSLSFFNSLNTRFITITDTNYLDQKYMIGSRNLLSNFQIELTELISPKNLLTISFSPEKNSNSAYQHVNNKDSLGTYDDYIVSQSRSIIQDIIKNTATIGWQYNTIKSSFNTQISYVAQKMNIQEGNNVIDPYRYSQKIFQSVLPSLFWKYNITPSKNLRTGYHTSFSIPNATNYYSMLNISNPLQITTGNPNLTGVYQHMVFIKYSSNHLAKNTSFFIMGNVMYSNSYMSNVYYSPTDTISMIINGNVLPPGAILYMPENLKGYTSFKLNSFYGKPLTFIKSNLGLNLGLAYSIFPSATNGQHTFTYSPSINVGFTLSSNISKNIDYTFSEMISYTNSINSNTNISQSFVNNIINSSLYYRLPKNFVLKTDLAFTDNFSKTSSSFNTMFVLLNTGIYKSIFKQKNGEIGIYAFDILNQNSNISRTVTNQYFQTTISNTITQYFMIQFRYDLRKFMNTNIDNPQNMPGRPPMGIPPGMPTHGGHPNF